jgi:hypothetical protein
MQKGLFFQLIDVKSRGLGRESNLAKVIQEARAGWGAYQVCFVARASVWALRASLLMRRDAAASRGFETHTARFTVIHGQR